MRSINKNYSWILIIFLLVITVILLIIAAFHQVISNYYLEKHSIKLYASTGNINYSDNDQHDYIYENIKLKTKISELQKELDNEKKKEKDLEEANKVDSRMNSYVVGIYEELIRAELLREQGNLLSAADIMRENVNKDYLLPDGSELESKVRSEVFSTGAIYYYNDGHLKFMDGKYDDAISSFAKSIYFQKNEYFCDDTLYFLGYCYYYKSKYDNAIATFTDLCNRYPESSHIGEVRQLLKIME